jgi:hypothetical protein
VKRIPRIVAVDPEGHGATAAEMRGLITAAVLKAHLPEQQLHSLTKTNRDAIAKRLITQYRRHGMTKEALLQKIEKAAQELGDLLKDDDRYMARARENLELTVIWATKGVTEGAV